MKYIFLLPLLLGTSSSFAGDACYEKALAKGIFYMNAEILCRGLPSEEGPLACYEELLNEYHELELYMHEVADLCSGMNSAEGPRECYYFYRVYQNLSITKAIESCAKPYNTCARGYE